MSIPSLFALAFVVGLSGALMPGPLTALALVAAAQSGFFAVAMVVLGHALLEFAVVAAVSLGFGKPLTRPGVVRAIGAVGGVVLIGLGALALLPSGESAARQFGEITPGRALWLGALVSATNPYWIVWWATVGMTFVTKALVRGPLGVVTFAVGHVSSDAVWLMLLGGIIAYGGRWLGDDVYRVLIIVCGAFLLAIGVYFLVAAAVPNFSLRRMWQRVFARRRATARKKATAR
jgi:threonine/homoserine/homoserine lactone efflux protein